MKDILKLFETIMDLKGSSFLVTEQSLIKNWRPFFILAVVMPSLPSRITVFFHAPAHSIDVFSGMLH